MGCNCIDKTLLEPCLEKNTGTKGSLIPILQKAQELYGYLPADLLAYIAERTGVKPAKVMGVVTFYTQFRTKPVGKHLILLCQGTACHVNGSAEIEEAIREHLGAQEGEITGDGLFTYSNVACLGCCSLAPAMMIIHPNESAIRRGPRVEKTYGNLTSSSAVKILKEIAAKEAAQLNEK